MSSKRPPPPRRPLSRGAMLCVRVPDEMKRRLQKVVKSDKCTLTEIVEEAIESWFIVWNK